MSENLIPGRALLRVALALAVAALAIQARAQKLQHVAFSSVEHAPIKRVLLLDVPAVQKYAAMDLGGGSAVFGVIGAAAGIARRESVAAKLNEEFARKPPELVKTFDSELERSLTKAGLEVVRMPGAQPRPGNKGTPPNYEDIKTDADAILTVRMTTVGFVSKVNVATEYYPITFTVLRLMSGDGRKLLMLSYVAYCTSLVKGDGITELPCASSVLPLKSDEELVKLDGPAADYLLTSAPATATAVAEWMMKTIAR